MRSLFVTRRALLFYNSYSPARVGTPSSHHVVPLASSRDAEAGGSCRPELRAFPFQGVKIKIAVGFPKQRAFAAHGALLKNAVSAVMSLVKLLCMFVCSFHRSVEPQPYKSRQKRGFRSGPWCAGEAGKQKLPRSTKRKQK